MASSIPGRGEASRFRWLRVFARLAISAALLAFVFSQTRDRLAEIDLSRLWSPFLPLAILFFMASKYLSAIRLSAFFQRIGISEGDASDWRLYWMGMYYNLLLPGGVSGDGYKAWLLSRRYPIALKTILGATLADRLSGLALLMLILLLFLPFSALSAQYTWPAIFLALIFPGAYVLFYRLVWRRYLPILLKVSLQAAGVQLLQVLSFLLLLLSLAPQADFIPYLILFLLSSVVAVLPLSIGGAGMREVTLLAGARFLGLDPALAVVSALAFFLISTLVALIGAWWSFFPIHPPGIHQEISHVKS